MSWIVFALGLAMLAVAGISGKQALDLLPTELGLIYAVAGASAGCAGVIVLSIGALIRRVDALGRRLATAPAPAAATAPVVNVPTPAAASVVAPAEHAPDHDIAPLREAPAAPASPKIVGRYSANSVDYTLYSDGSIEADTPTGARRFSSMAELRSALAKASSEDDAEG